MNEGPFRVIAWLLLLIVCAIIAVAITQHFRVGCIDLGFYKSCGVSVLR